MTALPRRSFLAGAAALGLAPLVGRLPAFGSTAAGRMRIARVAVSSPADLAALNRFDVLCGQRSTAGVDVLLWPGDERRLKSYGLGYDIVDDIPLNGGYRPYRKLEDYEAEMRALATRYPDRVRLFTLPERSLEGRAVYGVEIAGDVAAQDCRPVFYMDGLHHAREWPSGELTMNFANDLAAGYDTDAHIRRILDAVRAVLVPVVNVDGFNFSRQSVLQLDLVQDGGFWRKNRRSPVDEAGVAAARPQSASPGAYGVDPNRNYNHKWGGPGTSPAPADQTYHGLAPFSEPETRNVRSIVSSRPVVTAISNHTHGNLILRPWGDVWDDPPDEPLLKALGDAMAAVNGYKSQKGLGLYPTTGTADDYFYACFSTIGYTFEHGAEFHPPYDMYLPPMYAKTRGAYMVLLEATADPANHCVVEGSLAGPDGMRLRGAIRVTKDFVVPYNSEDPLARTMAERVDITAPAGALGRFELHLNPSTRPLATAPEAYTVTFSAAGYRPLVKELVLARGQRVNLGEVLLERA